MRASGDTGRSVLWFRRDLRLHDHPALFAAVARGSVAPLFVFDPRLLSGRFASPNRLWFMTESLRTLDGELRARGSQLHFRVGDPAVVVPAFARQARASTIFASRDYTPFARRRDVAVRVGLARDGVTFSLSPGHLARAPQHVLNAQGLPYRVFTPFSKAWAGVQTRTVLGAPSSVSHLAGMDAGDIPAVFDIRPTAAEMPEPGETAARSRLARWASGGLDRYADLRDRPDIDGTTGLSTDLRWGLLSPVEVLERCAGTTESHRRFRLELAWREFFAHLLWHFPNVASEAMQERYRRVAWAEDADGLAAWKAGMTGYPIVDAGMRQLLATGWMHNRVRMITASFLVKDLLIDWREGERFFMEHLFDGDVASNNGGWQWAASTGVDSQPYFRVFNPVLQGKKFDPEGVYVRRWVPELRGAATDRVHEPWLAGGAPGYPPPIVDHAMARERTLAAFKQAERAEAGRTG